MLAISDLLEDNLCTVHRLLVDFEVEEELVIERGAIVAVATLADRLDQLLVSEQVMSDHPADQLDFVEDSTRL